MDYHPCANEKVTRLFVGVGKHGYWDGKNELVWSLTWSEPTSQTSFQVGEPAPGAVIAGHFDPTRAKELVFLVVAGYGYFDHIQGKVADIPAGKAMFGSRASIVDPAKIKARHCPKR